MRYEVQIIPLTNLPALSQFKALVRINTTHGSRSETWLSRRNPASFIYPGFSINTVPQLRKAARLKQQATVLKLCGFEICYQISFPMPGLQPIVTSLIGEKMLKQTCAIVESSSSTFYTRTGSAMRSAGSH